MKKVISGAIGHHSVERKLSQLKKKMSECPEILINRQVCEFADTRCRCSLCVFSHKTFLFWLEMF